MHLCTKQPIFQAEKLASYIRDKKIGNHYYKVIRGFVDGILDENARKRCFEQLMDQFAWGCDAGLSASLNSSDQ